MAINMTALTNMTQVFQNTSPVTTNPISQVPMVPEYVQRAHFICEEVLVPIICCLGIIGNSLSLCVLTRREMAAATTCFLTAMAVSDLLLLTFQVPSFFHSNTRIANTDSFKLFFRYYTVIR